MFDRSKIEALRAVKIAIRNVYAWPGGYPMYVVCSDGAALSVKSAAENFRQIAHSTLHGYRDEWDCAGADINWEDAELTCAHSDESIECAYPNSEEVSHG